MVRRASEGLSPSPGLCAPSDRNLPATFTSSSRVAACLSVFTAPRAVTDESTTAVKQVQAAPNAHAAERHTAGSAPAGAARSAHACRFQE